MSASGRQLFIYWRAARADRDAALAAVRALQQDLRAAHPDLRAGLYLRSDDAAAATLTLMETYACPGGIDPVLAQRLGADAARTLQPWCQGDRHVEGFEADEAEADGADAALRIQALAHREPAVAHDILALLQVAHAQESRLLGGDLPTALARTVDEIRSSSAFYLGAFRGDRLRGLLALGPDDEPGHIHIATLVVDPMHQRQGLARRLLTEALRRVNGEALSVAAGERNAPALALYKGFGFVEYRRGTLPPHGVRFVKLRRPGDAG